GSFAPFARDIWPKLPPTRPGPHHIESFIRVGWFFPVCTRVHPKRSKFKSTTFAIPLRQMTYHSELGEHVFRERLKRIQNSMVHDSFDSLIVAGQPQFFPSYTGDIRYVANWAQYSSPTTMLITQDG